jgi:hypothetical protein
MTRYKMHDDTIVDTDLATGTWQEATDWNGNNHISRPTGSQWNHERLYRSAKGRYYLESTSQWQGSTPSAMWLTDENAARWLLLNDHELPEDLARFAREVCE